MCDLFKVEESSEFWAPVNTRKVPDYLDKVPRPIDLQIIKDNVKDIKYHSKQDFVADIKQVWSWAPAGVFGSGGGGGAAIT